MKYSSRIFLSLSILIFALAACGPTGSSLADLKSGSWLLTSLDGSAPVTGSSITLNFDKDSLGGSAGCNSYGGEYKLRGEKLSLNNVYSTEMYCEAAGLMDQEAYYLELLSKVESVSITGDTLTLTTSSGETLEFEAMTY